jgi:16S rRNA G527 N7-methylase RsmG
MAEASGKKCTWLRHLARTLKLKEAEVLEGRFEDLIKRGWGGSFDLAISRATAKPSIALAVARKFLTPGGLLLVYTTEGLTKKGVGRAHSYKVPGSRVPSVIWEVQF